MYGENPITILANAMDQFIGDNGVAYLLTNGKTVFLHSADRVWELHVPEGTRLEISNVRFGSLCAIKKHTRWTANVEDGQIVYESLSFTQYSRSQCEDRDIDTIYAGRGVITFVFHDPDKWYSKVELRELEKSE